MTESLSDPIEVEGIPTLPPRNPDGHKGEYGRVLVVGGSRGMAGAAGLAGMAALRGGAGLVTVACPAEVGAIVAGFEPSYMTMPLPADSYGRLTDAALGPIRAMRADVIAFGPGLGRSEALAQLTRDLLVQSPTPIVIDADGLNLLRNLTHHLTRRTPPTVLTPHVGEFARLSGASIEEIEADRRGHAVGFALRHDVVLVLKGRESVVTDGTRIYVNGTGNPGMATGGSGDVLTGLVAALIAQGLTPFDAARLAVHVHGSAGDLVGERSSMVSLIARDLVEALPEAFRLLACVPVAAAAQ